MTRPMYESEDDRKNEEIAINRILGPNDKAHKLPIKYELDFFVLRRDAPYAWVEVRTRKNKRDAYPDLLIAAKKIHTGIQLYKDSGLMFLLVADWQDQIATMRIYNTDGMKLAWGGRPESGRGDWQDMEPVYHINKDHFVTRFKKT